MELFKIGCAGAAFLSLMALAGCSEDPEFAPNVNAEDSGATEDDASGGGDDVSVTNDASVDRDGALDTSEENDVGVDLPPDTTEENDTDQVDVAEEDTSEGDVSVGPTICSENSDCQGGELCRDGLCREVCSDDDPCTGGLAECDPDEGICVECLENAQCDDGVCRGGLCTPTCASNDDCSAQEYCDTDEGICRDRECEEDINCSGGFRCLAFQCIAIDDIICQAGQVSCDGDGLLTCNAIGTEETRSPCPDDTVCIASDDADPECVALVCDPNGIGCLDSDTAFVCNATGTEETPLPCRDDQFCNEGACEDLACAPNTRTCDGDTVLVCNEDGSSAETIACDSLEACLQGDFGCTCLEGACQVRACEPNADRCVGNAAQVCDEDGLAWSNPEVCDGDEVCFRGDCRVVVCSEGERGCEGDTLRVCDESGLLWNETDCLEQDEICTGIGQSANCQEQICEPDSIGCLNTETAFVCDARGAEQEAVPCDDGLICLDGECLELECTPDERVCAGLDRVMRCDDGGLMLEEVCEAGSICNQGQCQLTCEPGPNRAASFGCAFWSADLPNVETGADSPHALMVFNPNFGASVDVAITSPEGILLSISPSTLAPGSLGIYQLEPNTGTDAPGQFDEGAWRLQATGPVGVIQINPLSTEETYTTDASLLLPSSVAGREYIAASWRHRVFEDGNTELNGFVTVVAIEAGSTTVTITPTADVREGPGIEGGIEAGETWVGALPRGAVLNLITDGADGGDLTGTSIEGNRDIMVFGGHACANLPEPETAACDHLEEQLLPVDLWGRHVVGTPFSNRNIDDTWMIIAGEDGVTLETSSGLDLSTTTLDRGEHVLATTRTAFELVASGPIQAVQFMHGSEAEGSMVDPRCSDLFSNIGLGDPAMGLAPAVAQWRRSYTMATPPGYLDDLLNIVAPAGTSVLVDGQAITDWFDVEGTGFVWAAVEVDSGIHTILGDRAFGLTSYGYDCFVSYANPGGINPQAVTQPRNNCDICLDDGDCGVGGDCYAMEGQNVCGLSCNSARDCGEGFECIDGTCRTLNGCSSGLDFCSTPPLCLGDRAYFDPGLCSCFVCLEDEHCGGDEICQNRTCVDRPDDDECNSDADCTIEENGNVEQGRCLLSDGTCYTPGSCGVDDPFRSVCAAGQTCTTSLFGGNSCSGCILLGEGCRPGEMCFPDLFDPNQGGICLVSNP